jgi:hypothetical protein
VQSPVAEGVVAEEEGGRTQTLESVTGDDTVMLLAEGALHQLGDLREPARPVGLNWYQQLGRVTRGRDGVDRLSRLRLESR